METARALELPTDRFSAGAGTSTRVSKRSLPCLLLRFQVWPWATPSRKASPSRSRPPWVKAVDAVRTAVREGFRDRVYLETEPDLEPLRNRDDFKQILGEIRPG